MGMLKSRADELERRLDQIGSVLEVSNKNLDNFVKDVQLLASDTEKIEEENMKLKKQLEDQEKKHVREMAEAARQQK